MLCKLTILYGLSSVQCSSRTNIRLLHYRYCAVTNIGGDGSQECVRDVNLGEFQRPVGQKCLALFLFRWGGEVIPPPELFPPDYCETTIDPAAFIRNAV